MSEDQQRKEAGYSHRVRVLKDAGFGAEVWTHFYTTEDAIKLHEKGCERAKKEGRIKAFVICRI